MIQKKKTKSFLRANNYLIEKIVNLDFLQNTERETLFIKCVG